MASPPLLVVYVGPQLEEGDNHPVEQGQEGPEGLLYWPDHHVSSQFGQMQTFSSHENGLPVNLHSEPHLWPCALGNYQKKYYILPNYDRWKSVNSATHQIFNVFILAFENTISN